MIVNKEHKEFFSIDFENGWEQVPGYPVGMDHKILVGVLDEENKTGARTRLLKMVPGIYTTTPFIHDYWEEVYLLQGDLFVGNDEHGNGGEQFHKDTYACRPPGSYSNCRNRGRGVRVAQRAPQTLGPPNHGAAGIPSVRPRYRPRRRRRSARSPVHRVA